MIGEPNSEPSPLDWTGEFSPEYRPDYEETV